MKKVKLGLLLLLAVFLFNIGHFSVNPSIEAEENPQVNPSTVAELPLQLIRFSETSNYVRLDFGMFAVEFYKGSAGYNKVYDSCGDVLVYDDRLVLEFFKSPKWKQKGTPTGLSYVKVSGYHYNVTRFYTDYLGTTYNVTYVVKTDEAMKIALKLSCGETGDYRVAWSPSGITKQEWTETPDKITFGNKGARRDWVSFSWEDVHQTFGDIADVAVESVAQGRKANIYFNIGAVQEGTTVTVDPALVASTAYDDVVGWAFQRQIIYASSHYFFFYANNSRLLYKTSKNGIVWGNLTVVSSLNVYDGDDFSLWYTGGATVQLVFLWSSWEKLQYLNGTISGTTITWNVNVTAITSLVDVYRPVVSIDSSDYPWLGYYNSSTYDLYAVRASATDGSSWETPTKIFDWTTTGHGISIVPLTNRDMYAACGDTNYANGSRYVNSTSSWQSSDEIWYNPGLWSDTLGISMVSKEDRVYFIQGETTNQMHFCYYDGSSWSDIKPSGGEDTAPQHALSVALNSTTEDLYVSWLNGTSGVAGRTLYQRKRVNSTGNWDARITVASGIPASGTVLRFHSIMQTCNGNHMCVGWLEGTGGSYNIRFSVYPGPPAPSIGEFQAPSTVYANQGFFLNCTVADDDGNTTIVNATLELSHDIILKYDNTTDTFSEYQDSNNYCVLDVANSVRTEVNSTAFKLAWKIRLNWTFPEGTVNIVVSNTKVFDSDDQTGTGSQINLFTFEDDLIIHVDAAANDTCINPSQGLRINGTIYYQGTSTVPENTSGIVTYVELSGVQKGNDTDVTSGVFNVNLTGESSVAEHSYNVYAMTDQLSVTNRTVNVNVTRILVSWSVNTTLPETGKGINITLTSITYEHDGSAVTSHQYDVDRNTTLWIDDATNSSFTDTRGVDGVYIYDLSALQDVAGYGITSFVEPSDITVTWSVTLWVEVNSKAVGDTRLDVSTNNTIFFHARWSMNQSSCPSGTIQVNGTDYSINATGWISLVHNETSVLEPMWTVTNATSQGVTDWKQTCGNATAIWDRKEVVSGGAVSSKIDTGTYCTVYFVLKYQFDSAVVTTGNVLVNGSAATYSSARARWEYQEKQDGDATKKFGVSTSSGDTYNITALLHTASLVTVEWYTPASPGGPGGVPPPYVPPTEPPITPPTQVPPSPLVMLGVVVIVAVMLIASVSGEIEGKLRTSQKKWKKQRKTKGNLVWSKSGEKKKPKWKRKKPWK